MASFNQATDGHFEMPTDCDNCKRKARRVVMEKKDEVKQICPPSDTFFHPSSYDRSSSCGVASATF